MPAKLRPVVLDRLTLTRSGRSANIDFFRTDPFNREAIYVEVLRDDFYSVMQSGRRTMKARPIPIYRVTIHQRGATKWIQTHRFDHTPEVDYKNGHVPDEILTRLVREKLET